MLVSADNEIREAQLPAPGWERPSGAHEDCWCRDISSRGNLRDRIEEDVEILVTKGKPCLAKPRQANPIKMRGRSKERERPPAER